MKDFLGNVLKIGNDVVFIAPNYRILVKGRIIDFTKKNVRIEYINDWNYSGRPETILQSPTQLIYV